MTKHTRRILRLPEVEAKVGLKHDSIYRGAREGWFPKPFKLSERASGWFEHELDEWLEKRAAAREAPTTRQRQRTVRAVRTHDAAPPGVPVIVDAKKLQ
jgi:prophage regulatory protein